MSDNDLIRRGDVRKLAEWVETEDWEVLAVDMDDVDDIPAVPDAVSVVRCKGCKHWDKKQGQYCNMTGMSTDEDFYCAYGERSDE